MKKIRELVLEQFEVHATTTEDYETFNLLLHEGIIHIEIGFEGDDDTILVPIDNLCDEQGIYIWKTYCN
jgi:hypothetical protein